jgi:hypothetical protein
MTAAAAILFIEMNAIKMGNYDPILMKFDTLTKKNMLGSKVRKAGMIDRFQDGRRRRHVGTSML